MKGAGSASSDDLTALNSPPGTSSTTSEDTSAVPESPPATAGDELGGSLEASIGLKLSLDDAPILRQVTPSFPGEGEKELDAEEAAAESDEPLGPVVPPDGAAVMTGLARLRTPEGPQECQVCLAMGGVCISCQAQACEE